MKHPLIDEVAQVRNRIEELKAELKALKPALQIRIQDTLQGIENTEDRYRLAVNLYWNEEDLVNVASLGRGLGIPEHQVTELMRVTTIIIPCSECGKDQEYIPRSRSDSRLRDSGYYVCEDCKQSRNDRYRQDEERQRQILETLKAMPYQEYLRTEHWQGIRSYALKRAKFKCQVCNKGDVTLNVHHRTYANRGNEQNADVITLCHDCHELFHRNGKLVKG